MQATVEIVGKISSEALERPTPCSGWTVRDLLEHQVAQNHGFAFAASGERSELDRWAPRPIGDDHVAVYTESAAAVLDAFDEPDVLERDFWLPEIREGAPIPAKLAVGFLFVDCVVHGWDLAKAIGVPPNVDSDLAEAALPIAEAVPDTADSRGPGKAFYSGVAVALHARPLDRVVAVLGRSPGWTSQGR